MNSYPVFDKLREMNEPVPIPAKLPTEQEVDQLEAKLGVKLAPSYREYLLHYSDVNVGTFEPYWVYRDGSYLDLIQGILEARQDPNFPRHYMPFLCDNGDYYCFDLKSPGPEYQVVYWSHNGPTQESWRDFPTWVEECWIAETLEDE